MQGKENISEEIRQVSGLVADISRKEPFEVPQGYFEGLAGRILELVQAGDRVEELSPALSGLRHLPVHTAPAGYFEDFAGKMLAHIHASEELAGISSLLSGIGKKTPFTVPGGYFDQPGEYMSRLTGKTGSLSTQDMENGSFAAYAEDGSFSALEPDSFSPVLAGLKDKVVYQAPEGYFTGLADTVLAAVKKQSGQARVVSIGFGRKWIKYAAAAIVAGMLVTGGWLGLHRSPAPGVSNDITNNLAQVSDQEIQNYLDNADVVPLADAVTNSTATLEITDSDARNLLGDVPDGELKTYLEEHSAFQDAVTN